MRLPHIVAVDLASDGIVVRYDDASTAFYHESVLQQHLLIPAAAPQRGRTRRTPMQDDAAGKLHQSAA